MSIVPLKSDNIDPTDIDELFPVPEKPYVSESDFLAHVDLEQAVKVKPLRICKALQLELTPMAFAM